MQLCELLLPPIDVRGERYSEIGDQFELVDSDVALFGSGENPVIRVVGATAPEGVESTDETIEPATPAKAKAKR
jgi:hypothetical protein